jgi:hypothetical protein
VTPDPAIAKAASEGMMTMVQTGRRFTVATWNIAAINNNPFEYWITMKENPAYEQLMVNVEQFLENPQEKDVPVSEVFTEEMFTKLDGQITKVGWTSVRSYWEKDFKDRKIVSQFMKVNSLERMPWISCVLVMLSHYIFYSHKLSTFYNRILCSEVSDLHPCQIALRIQSM